MYSKEKRQREKREKIEYETNEATISANLDNLSWPLNPIPEDQRIPEDFFTHPERYRKRILS
jgi:hypothetical protein